MKEIFGNQGVRQPVEKQSMRLSELARKVTINPEIVKALNAYLEIDAQIDNGNGTKDDLGLLQSRAETVVQLLAKNSFTLEQKDFISFVDEYKQRL